MPETEMIRFSSADFEEAMDFMNMVFSMSGASTDFATLLPKLYRPDDRLMRDNLAIRRNGRLRAVVGSYPMQLQVGQAVLSVRGIGGVSTHPAERKSGLMRQLMLAALDEMDKEHCAMSILGGQRQRYGYYGYERCGRIMTSGVNKSNLRHFFHERQSATVRFTRIMQEGTDQPENAVHLMKSWHDSQPVHMHRSETDFLTILSSWYHRVWLASDDQERMLGYLVANGDGTSVSELITADPKWILDIAAAWAQRQKSHDVHYNLPPWQTEALRTLMTLGESVTIDSAYCFRINDWPLVLSSFLQVQGSLKTLAEGVLRLGVINSAAGPAEHQIQRTYALVWKNGRAECRELAGDPADRPDLLLDSLTATRLVFGPLSSECILADADLFDPQVARLLTSWFPLPVCILESDHI